MQYTFQQVFDEYTTQKAMFDAIAMSLVEDVLRGKNGTIVYFCYFFDTVKLMWYTTGFCWTADSRSLSDILTLSDLLMLQYVHLYLICINWFSLECPVHFGTMKNWFFCKQNPKILSPAFIANWGSDTRLYELICAKICWMNMIQ